ncbi:hypothetical protein EST38_g2716 [Candolleomyces aberdarensis]|uniref:Uncharacterized protein n=1 Tax=Candolleomyces aberdarensis TaxID=2316362 RepID=A0A4Q2DVD5_9AGAR|nr:hypothetical protein EST38_g2716 [Candolleomyces aberdarensis]
MRKEAIGKLEDHKKLNTIERIKLAEEHHISSWLFQGYKILVQRKTGITETEAEQIGWRVALKLCGLREHRLQQPHIFSVDGSLHYTFTSGLAKVQEEEAKYDHPGETKDDSAAAGPAAPDKVSSAKSKSPDLEVEAKVEDPAVEVEAKAQDPAVPIAEPKAEDQIEGSETKVEEAVTEVAPPAEPQPEEDVDKGLEPPASKLVEPGEGLTFQFRIAPALNDVRANDTEGIDSPVDDKRLSKRVDKAARKKAKRLAEEKAVATAHETDAESMVPSEEPALVATPNMPATRAAKLNALYLPKTESLIDSSFTPSSAVQPPLPPPPKHNAASPTATRGGRVPLSERLSKPTPSAWPPTPDATDEKWPSSSLPSGKPWGENGGLKRFESLWG